MERGFRVAPLSREELRAQAMGLRSLLNLNQPFFPIVELMDIGLSKFFPDFVFDVMTVDEMGAEHGRTVPDEGLIIIREDVYKGARRGVGRDRFTMAHELGHLYLHRGVSLSRTFFNRRKPHPPFEDSEWQANGYAAELLMPVAVAQEHSTNEFRLAEACGVSVAAAVHRLRTLKGARLIK